MILIGSAFSGGSATAPAIDDGAAVALVEGNPVTSEAFKQEYVEYLLRTGAEDSARMRRAVLARMVNERLLIAEARSKGIEETSGYRAHAETVRKKLSIELYLERAVLKAVAVTESDLEEAFVRINTTVTARHLFARTRGEADRLHERLLNGERFEALAREAFVDTALANNGGSIGSFTFDETDPDFEDAAYGLAVGEISAPVRTAHGYSIIQVTDRFTEPILTELDYAKRKAKLQPLVLRKKRTQARSHFLRSLADEMSATFHEPAFGQLLGQITGTSIIESFEAFLDEPLVSFAAGSWTVDAFRSRAAETDPRRRAAVRTEMDLKEFVTGLIVREELLARAEALAGTQELEHAIQRELETWILKTKKEELTDSVIVSEADARRHFEAFPNEYTDETGEALSFDEAAPRIREQLHYTLSEEYILEYVSAMRKRHAVDVDEQALFGLEIAGRRTES